MNILFLFNTRGGMTTIRVEDAETNELVGTLHMTQEMWELVQNAIQIGSGIYLDRELVVIFAKDEYI